MSIACFAYWETKTSVIDKQLFQLINEIIEKGISIGEKDLKFQKSFPHQFLYLEQTGQHNWLIRDPMLGTDPNTVNMAETIPTNSRTHSILAEVSIHEALMEEQTYYEIFLWSWNNLDDPCGTIVIEGIDHQNVDALCSSFASSLEFIQI